MPMVKSSSTTPISAICSTWWVFLMKAERMRPGQHTGDQKADDGRELEPAEKDDRYQRQPEEDLDVF